MKIDLYEDDFNSDEYEPISAKDLKFGEELFNLLQDLINSDEIINEEFISRNCAYKHYRQHCLCGIEGRKSRKTNIYYDFDNIDKYRLYENKVSERVRHTNDVIDSLYEEGLLPYFKKLFGGSVSLYFPTCCGFHNNNGAVSIGLNSFASDVTKNYLGNTINLIVFVGGTNKTITMFPIDAHYLETKFNSILKKYTPFRFKLKYNNE